MVGAASRGVALSIHKVAASKMATPDVGGVASGSSLLKVICDPSIARIVTRPLKLASGKLLSADGASVVGPLGTIAAAVELAAFNPASTTAQSGNAVVVCCVVVDATEL